MCWPLILTGVILYLLGLQKIMNKELKIDSLTQALKVRGMCKRSLIQKETDHIPMQD